VHLRQPNI
jgi:hypothetical protein